MEIRSSLINSKELKLLKDSLIAASEVDGKENFRVRLIEYIDDTADNEDDEFFYDMIEFVRFLKPDPETTAYTTPEHLIFMNAPGVFGEKIREWDFVYCHECLHQLWETFDVAEQIKKNGVKYDHYVLNIASDCVINDYLSAIRKKTAPPDGITPEYLKEQYGIDYDRKVDTQYTLYLKLLEVAEKLKKDQRCQSAQDGDGGQSGEGQEGQGSSSSGNSSSGDGSSGNKSDSQNKTASDAQKSADEAKNAADKAQQNADSGKGSQENADAAKEAAKEAQDAANKAKEAADKGDKEGEAKAAQEAKDAADKAKALAGEGGDGKDSDGKDGNDAGDKGGNASKGGEGGDDKDGDGKGQGRGGSSDKDLSGEMTEEQKAQIKAKAEGVIKKFKEKISGAFGDFVKKCKNSVKCDPNGLANNTKKGKGAWNKQMDLAINAYVKKNLDKKRRQFEQTYKRVKRGSGIVKMGAPIIPGKRIKDDKMPINIAYYIDRSGSMSGCIDKVFEAAFKISEALKQRFRKDKLVKNTDFRTFVFNDRMNEIKFGQTAYASGGTMDFDEILKFISKNTKNVLINIIITDAGFNVNETEVKNFLKKEVDGLVIFITNCENAQVKKIANENEFKTKLIYILADANFNVE
jgi:predicted metal-dependent peptidase